MSIIKPTIGRKVWFHYKGDRETQPGNSPIIYQGSSLPMDATIIYVFSDRRVNLSVTDHLGHVFTFTSVMLRQGDEEYVPVTSYCEWMPYQMGQAKKDAKEDSPIAVEKPIKAAGSYPKVTQQGIEHTIVSEHYFTARDGAEGACNGGGVYPIGLGLLTFCVLVLRNGFTVTGESACASPENFNAEIGRTVARENAINKVWMLEGYLLKQQLHTA